MHDAPAPRAGLWLLAVASLYLEPVAWAAPRFRVPCSPLFPCLGMLANVFLIASLGAAAYVRFGVWLLLSVAFYCLYSVHSGAPGGYGGAAADRHAYGAVGGAGGAASHELAAVYSPKLPEYSEQEGSALAPGGAGVRSGAVVSATGLPFSPRRLNDAGSVPLDPS